MKPIKTEFNKSTLAAHLAETSGVEAKQVKAVLESLVDVGHKELKKSGLFTVPGFAKFRVVTKPATKAREGVNPFTGEKMVFKAKPASKKVRVMPLKNLKGFVN
mgnify:CR=1 FL=1